MSHKKDFREMLTPRQVSQRYGLAVKTLANLRYEKRGPCFFKLGNKKVLYAPSDIENWLKANATRVETEKFL